MAQITINEISQNYTYNIGTSSYCTVALPITASWGPGYFDPAAQGKDVETVLENTVWERFPANQEGLEAFVSTYRGPAANYRLAKDFSYQMAMTLLTAGYDILVCRMCPGTHAQVSGDKVGNATVTVKAKYPGTFGNQLSAVITTGINKKYSNLVVYVTDASGVRTAVENVIFAANVDDSTDTIPHLAEIESDFVILEVEGELDEATLKLLNDVTFTLSGGDDRAANKTIEDAIELAKSRFSAMSTDSGQYVAALESVKDTVSEVVASTIAYKEWLYTHAVGVDNTVGGVYDLLKDKLAYNPNRVISPGWDDQNILDINSDEEVDDLPLSPLHIKLMDVSYYSRCATGYIDVPKSLPRKSIHDTENEGYAQKLARYATAQSLNDINVGLYPTHAALFGPWGQYTYVGTGKHNIASPSFLALMIQRAMILNQPIRYEWALPTSRSHNLKIGALDYKTPKKVLDKWQDAKEGVGVNVITQVPDLGTCLWGNSTLYELPPATYQALANLSTRLLFNAIEDVAYRVGVSITYQYNNDEAYARFYAGVTPILDTMRNVGAIDGYKVKMSADINGLDQVNANTVIGKIYLIINGVINDIAIDLVALPPGSDLSAM